MASKDSKLINEYNFLMSELLERLLTIKIAERKMKGVKSNDGEEADIHRSVLHTVKETFDGMTYERKIDNVKMMLHLIGYDTEFATRYGQYMLIGFGDMPHFQESKKD